MDQIAAFASLQRYLTGEYNDANGEYAMRCPRPEHPDQKRSASVNFDKQEWFCARCNVGGPLEQLLHIVSKADAEAKADRKGKRGKAKPLSADDVSLWQALLQRDRKLLRALQRRRGLAVATMQAYGLGYDPVVRRYTIPIYDSAGVLINVRRYDPDGDPKMINMTGHGDPALYPISQLKEPGPIIICEGELDALTLIQNGFPAITRTSSAGTWLEEWSEYFFGRDVYLCHDADTAGQAGNTKCHEALRGIANSISTIDLGYPITEKGGADVTDWFWRDKGTADDFKKKMAAAHEDTATVERVTNVNVLGSTAGEFYGSLLEVRATVTGRSNQTKIIPHKVHVQCDQSWDEEVCQECPMYSAPAGHRQLELSKYKKDLLDYAFRPRDKNMAILRREHKIPKDCPRVKFDITGMHTVERAWLREPVDTAANVLDKDQSADAADLRTSRSVYILSKYDTQPSQTLRMTGRMYQHPQNNDNEFVVLDVEEVDTDIDKFEVTDEVIEQLAQFQQLSGTVDERLATIADDLANNVTGIYARRDMHILMDLVFHSALSFPFHGAVQNKGWLDVLVAGDTRTGKSETANRLIDWYRLGTSISCETASIAGVLAGMHQPGDGRWEVSWGVIPTNDRRLVVLDEVTGLSVEQIQRMSQARTAGLVSMHKVDSGDIQAPSRTRLIWIANPRRSKIRRGTRMVEDIIGNREDIARFDCAMSVHSDDPGVDAANDPSRYRGAPLFDREAYRALVMWAWTRKPEDIHWEMGAEDLVFNTARRMGRTFLAETPLVQTSSVRFKIARLAVAVAQRLYSTTNGLDVLITREHVLAARDLMLRIYKNPKFGYYEDSQVVVRRSQRGYENIWETKEWLIPQVGLCEYLRSVLGIPFRPQNIRDSIDVAFNQASNLTSELKRRGLVEDENVVNNTFISTQLLEELLREIPS